MIQFQMRPSSHQPFDQRRPAEERDLSVAQLPASNHGNNSVNWSYQTKSECRLVFLLRDHARALECGSSLASKGA